MDHKVNLDLVDGHFSPEEAKEVLYKLFTDKIKFHQLKSFCALEKSGKEDQTSLNRIKELKQSLKLFDQFLSEFKDKDVDVQISASVDVTVRTNQEA